jgi:hypothetical protein
MASSFAWVDFSEADRRRTQDVLDLLNERDTRDELGLGVVRDALADLLFPGTSTLHTRARYFLFIPWVYQRLADKGVASSEVARRARKAELELIDPLKENEDHEGIIGATAEERLKRLPSSMYWAGLGVWGVRLFPGSQAQYHRGFERIHAEDDDPDDEGQPSSRTPAPWDPGLPKPPADFPGKVGFALTRTEAEYLQHRIQTRGPSLLAHLVRRGTTIEATDFPWERSDAEGWPIELSAQVEHARNFSEAMHGAALLYNLMLAEELKREDWQKDYVNAFASWAGLMQSRRQAHGAWHRDELWALVAAQRARVALRTRAFIDGWLALSLAEDPATLGTNAAARELVRRREQQLKRTRARLGNPGALARWSGSAGAGQLDYRWRRVQAVTSDILRGLARKD